jgi:predicted esterase
MRKVLLSLAVLFIGLYGFSLETYQYAEKDGSPLFLDIHRPAEGAPTVLNDVRKPAILYVFGGGFVKGARDEDYVLPWYKQLNDDGYTVVAIDYRLGMRGYKVGKGLAGAAKAVGQFVLSQQMGVEDVFTAVQYLAEHPELGIDTGNIVLAGSSAGAIISVASALAVANGHAEALGNGFRFKGVMSFAGGIISNSGAPSFKTAPCPLLLMHGMKDKAVAYKHFGAFGKGVWGSSYIAAQLKKKGWHYSIWRFKNREHAVAAYMSHLWPIEKAFLERNVIMGIPCVVDAVVDDSSLPEWKEWSTVTVEEMYNGDTLSEK